MNKPLFRPNDKKIKLQKQQLEEFKKYLIRCTEHGFTGVNDFHRMQEKREEFMKYALLTFTEKVVFALLRNSQNQSTKSISVPVNYPEELTLLMMFNRVAVCPYVEAIQSTIVFQLKTEPNHKLIYKLN